jgi:multiple sugar transport system substrate-binding protein
LARSKPDTYLSEQGTPICKDMFHAPLPKGPAGQFSYHVPFSNIVPTYVKDPKPAKEFLRWFQSKDVYGQWFTSQQGFSVGATKMWQDDPLWKIDPIMSPFRTAALSGRFAGYAGPAGRAAAEAISKFIIVDMYTKAVQGMAPEDSVKWAHGEMVKIYNANG